MKKLIFALILVFSFGFSAFAQTEKAPCPTLTVTGGGVVQSGEPMNFVVNVSGLSDTANLKYKWEISNGTISGDSEAQTMTIDTTGISGGTNITAKVKVIGLPENCANITSETGTIFRGGDPRSFDEFGKLSNNDILARIQNLYVELGNNTDMQGYIINYGTDREFAARKRQIESAIKRLKLDLSRVTIINGGANPREKGVWTKIWIVPKEAANPTTIYTKNTRQNFVKKRSV